MSLYILIFKQQYNNTLFYSGFVYEGVGNAYARCFYIGLKTAVSIGKNPKPDRDLPREMIFFGSLWLMGVFVFAVLIGKVCWM